MHFRVHYSLSPSLLSSFSLIFSHILSRDAYRDFHGARNIGGLYLVATHHRSYPVDQTTRAYPELNSMADDVNIICARLARSSASLAITWRQFATVEVPSGYQQ